MLKGRRVNDFEAKKVINVNIFDRRDLAKSYAEGTRNLGSIQDERRGWYLRKDKTEFLLYFPDPTLRGKPVSLNRAGKHP
jgi:hypothetical protein